MEMTPHFQTSELFCRCGCGMLPAQDFMDKVELLRVSCDFSFPITSAARCPDYNATVSGTGRTGPHTTGRAIDIGVRGSQAHKLLTTALAMGFTGIGVAQKGSGRFIHLDDLPDSLSCPRSRIWSY